MGIDRELFLIPAAENESPVFHGTYPEDRPGNMDDRIDIAEVDIQSGFAANRAPAGSYSIEAPKVFSACKKILLIAHRQCGAS